MGDNGSMRGNLLVQVVIEPWRPIPGYAWRSIVVVVNLTSRKRELVYWVVLCSDPTVVPVVVWRLFTST